MDYEQKYNEALEHARAEILANPGLRKTWEEIFPELAESEDERIRQGLIRLMTVAGEAYVFKSTGIKKDSYLAYLEKQKEEEGYEAIPVESTLEYKLGFNAGKEARWRPTEEQVDALERTVRLSNFGCDKERRNALLSLLEQLKQGDGKQEEQKPAEWSDEDKKMLNELITIMDGGIVTSGTYLSEYAAWLKSLRPVKQEWDAHDKAAVTCIACCLDGQFVTEAARKQALEWFNKHRRDFLNSTSWKPSEEQMKALQNAVALTACDKELARLYNQLKKLI